MTEDLVEQINVVLPQTQCGQCGYAGCEPYARAVSRGEAINKCPPGGELVIDLLAELTARPAIPLNTAHGVHGPATVAAIREAECIGCTKCIQACPVDAIIGAPKLMHTVITSECTGCDLCIDPCPVDCIDVIKVANRETRARDESRHRRLSAYRRARFETRKHRLARDAALRRGSRRRSVARPENPDAVDSQLRVFSRERAREEIADAVARVKKRRRKDISSSRKPDSKDAQR